MVSVVSRLIEEVTEHAQSDSLEDEREVCADGTFFPNSLRIYIYIYIYIYSDVPQEEQISERCGWK